jgi:hypothetical protein
MRVRVSPGLQKFEKMKKKDESKVIGILYYCDNLKKEVVTDVGNLSSSESECETCGSHGYIRLSVYDCECGKSHDIEISSW